MSLHRRPLDESQRAMVAAKVATLTVGRPKGTAGIHAVSQTRAGKMLNVSRDSVQKARRVRAKGAPELVKAVEDGKLAVSAAAALTGMPKDKQREALARIEETRQAGGRRKPPAKQLAGSPDGSWRGVREALDHLAGCPLPAERLAQLVPFYRAARMAAHARKASRLLAALADHLEGRPR
jgi:hypothetical protein